MTTIVTETKPVEQRFLYQPKPETRHFDDGRETELLHWIYNQPNLDEIRGSPQKIIDLIDNFGQNRHFMMNVGPTKGKVITDLIAKVKPHTMIELGGYVGYSAILFGDALRRAGGQRYISLERNPEFGAIVMALVDLAGLKDVVQVVIGSSDRSLHRLHAEGQVDKIEMMFLDHFKPAYTTDLKLCEQLGMVQPGSLMVADNVYVPGAPVYLKYVRSTIESKRAEAKEAKQEHSLEGTSERHRNQYLNKVDQEKPAFAVTGNPNLVYENETVEEWDVSGSWDAIQLTKCVGVADD